MLHTDLLLRTLNMIILQRLAGIGSPSSEHGDIYIKVMLISIAVLSYRSIFTNGILFFVVSTKGNTCHF